jgi:hypothetical protein
MHAEYFGMLKTPIKREMGINDKKNESVDICIDFLHL